MAIIWRIKNLKHTKNHIFMIINNWEDIQFVINRDDYYKIGWLCLGDIVSCEEMEDENNNGKYKYEYKTYKLIDISIISKNVCNKRIQCDYNDIQKYSDVKFRLREFLHNNNYLEVNIPILTDWETSSKARSFETHHNTIEKKLFLRKTMDSFLRMLSCCDLNKIYSIWPCFRNENIKALYNPEFEMLSIFTNYMNQTDAIELTIQILNIILDWEDITIEKISFNDYTRHHTKWIFYIIDWFDDDSNNYSAIWNGWKSNEFKVRYNDITLIHWVMEINTYEEYIDRIKKQWKKDNYWELQILEDMINSWAPTCFNIGVSILRILSIYNNKKMKDYDIFLFSRLKHG